MTIVIPADHEKGGKNRVYPVAPEFAEMLLSVPEFDRTGFVFNPKPIRVIGGRTRATDAQAGRTVVKIGKRCR
ncbi:MAG: hypothetical protein ACKVHE_17900 [Planctomycetales bacterium]